MRNGYIQLLSKAYRELNYENNYVIKSIKKQKLVANIKLN